MCCNGFNGRDLVASEKHPSSNYIVCDDQFSEGSTVFRIVDAAIVVDLQGLGKDARLDIHRLLALDVGDIGREESDASRITAGLCGDILGGCILEKCSSAVGGDSGGECHAVTPTQRSE